MRRLHWLLVPLLVAGCSAQPEPPVAQPPAVQAPSAVQAPALAPAPSPLAEHPAAWVGTEALPFWTADGSRLLYTAPWEHGPTGPAMLLELAEPGRPRQVSNQPAYGPTLSPDGRQLVYVSPRADASATVSTIWLKPLDGGDAVDLLPGALAVRGVSTVKEIHRWLDDRILAYHDHMGSGIQELSLIDTAAGRILETPRLSATFFTWTAAGDKVAGQMYGGPASFWVWDRQQNKQVTPRAPFPGQFQWFESWTDDGDALYFTAWEGYPYSPEAGDAATLYRWELAGGTVVKVAEQAALAMASGEDLAYIRLGPAPMLVVTRGGATVWTEEVALPESEAFLYRPGFVGPFLSYRSGEEWRVASRDGKGRALVHTGLGAALSWAPDGRHAALLVEGSPATLKVIRNPLAR